MSATIDRDQRARGAVLAQFVGDALCLGSHWYYNLADRRRVYPGGIEGFEAPVAGHYHAGREPGDPTHYGDAAMVLLRSVAERGRADPVDYGRRFVALFDPETYEGYLDKPTRLTVQAFRDAGGDAGRFSFQRGADDAQNVTTSRLAPVVVRHAADPDLDGIVERITRVCQDNPDAVAHALVHAHVLRRLLAGEPLEPALDAVIGGADGPVPLALAMRYEDAKAMREVPVVEATGEFGRSCYLPSTFPSLMHAALKHGHDLPAALLECCRAGGDNASRCAVLGSWLGAAHGIDAVPAPWRQRLKAAPEVEALTGRLLSAG
ncbi:MAG TPA: ADP-ribosylglycohydrolase family protein [Geminicoccaceae bacterium]|nr:ADP-ribosylglycohydrolase family protein [Geminicoccus sp.]HMU48173.1 ADP-ribosylglycohydrolase family protein [Geminicoccaceae bacterium]